eukprot:SAG31_NODE_24306_length_484_cov_1.290909_1_plen_48_part_10
MHVKTDDDGPTFTQWMLDNGKVYDENELAFRARVFKANLQTIREHNSR